MLVLEGAVFIFVLQHFASAETGTDNGQADDPVGHMLPLGSHRPSEGSIEQVDSFPHPADFYRKYVQGPGKPVVFKGAGKAIPAFNLWTDEYLRSTYGHLDVKCEHGKKENRSQNVQAMTMKTFLDVYNEKEIYMVEDVEKEMQVDLSMPRSLQCGGFQHALEMVVMWFSSGGTKSVLHHDDLDNINCLFAGQKELVMIDKKYQANVEADHWKKERGFSRMDVEQVDLYKFPEMRDVPWYTAHMDTGDCLFIPINWYHTVDSSKTRNLAVNLWFNHRMWFNESDCENLERPLTDLEPLNQYAMSDPETVSVEGIRSSLFQSYTHLDKITIEDMSKDWEFEDEYLFKLFDLTDENKDDALSWEEIYKADLNDLLQGLMEQYKAARTEQTYEGEAEYEYEIDEHGGHGVVGQEVDEQEIEKHDHDEF